MCHKEMSGSGISTTSVPPIYDLGKRWGSISEPHVSVPDLGPEETDNRTEWESRS